MAERVEVDYAESLFVAPTTEPELAFEAARSCTPLLMAFAYADAWPGNDRAEIKLSRQAARHVRKSFATDQGQEAISWISQSYGRVLAEMRRRAAEREPGKREQLLATASVDEWLVGLVAEQYAVHQEEALEVAREHNRSRFFDPDNPEALVDLKVHVARADVTIEMLAIVTWPASEEIISALTPWTYMYDTSFHHALGKDWTHVALHWANLLQPEPRSRYQVGKERGWVD